MIDQKNGDIAQYLKGTIPFNYSKTFYFNPMKYISINIVLLFSFLQIAFSQKLVRDGDLLYYTDKAGNKMEELGVFKLEKTIEKYESGFTKVSQNNQFYLMDSEGMN